MYLLVIQQFIPIRVSPKNTYTPGGGIPPRAKARGFHPEELDDHRNHAGFNGTCFSPNYWRQRHAKY